MDVTNQYRVLDNHINHSKGAKTVCVSTCLNYFGISPDKYHYTSSKNDIQAWKNVLRRHGVSVRSRRSEFKTSKFPTMTEIRARLKKSSYTSRDRFVVTGYQSKSGHLMVLDGDGNTIIDTAKGMRWRIGDISIVN
jgi:hypothetical protein